MLSLLDKYKYILDFDNNILHLQFKSIDLN